MGNWLSLCHLETESPEKKKLLASEVYAAVNNGFQFFCNHVQVQVFLQRGEELTILLEVSAAACALLWNKMNFMSFCTVMHT